MTTPTITPTFDWSRTLQELAAELGCSHETARKLRIESGYVHCPSSNEIREYLRQNPTRNIAECARLLGIARQTVYNHLHGLDQRRALPWTKMDWRLPSAILARIWECNLEGLEDERTNRTHNRPVWDLRQKGRGYGCAGDINLKLAVLNELQRRDLWVEDPASLDLPPTCVALSLAEYAKPIGLEHVQQAPELMEDVVEPDEPSAPPTPEAPAPQPVAPLPQPQPQPDVAAAGESY